MGFTQQFMQQPNYPEGELPGQFPNPALNETKLNIATTLGITAIGMIDVIISDISKLLQNDQQYSLDGYILCLSRIVAKEIGWRCIQEAFHSQNQPIPSTYKKLFNSEI